MKHKTMHTMLRNIVFILSTPLFEDFYEKHGINLKTYLLNYKDEWSFFYASLLKSLGFKPIFYFITCKCSINIAKHITGAYVRYFKCTRLFRLYRGILSLIRKTLSIYLNRNDKSLRSLSLRIIHWFFRSFEDGIATINPMMIKALIVDKPMFVYVQEYESFRFDIVALICWLLDIPAVAQYHGMKPNASQIFKGITMRLVNYLLCTTKLECERLQRYYKVSSKRIMYIPNFVDTDFFKPIDSKTKIRSVLGLDPNDFIILFIGRLDNAHKNVKALLQVLYEFRKKGLMNIKLIIIGKGPDELMLKKYASKLKLGNAVRFEGFVPREKLPLYYNVADIFVLPSNYEGFPIVLLEALSCGLPVIATNVGGVAEVLPQELKEPGYLVPPKNIKALMEAIHKAYQNRSMLIALSNTCRQYVTKNYSLYAVKRKFKYFIRQLTKKVEIHDKSR